VSEDFLFAFLRMFHGPAIIGALFKYAQKKVKANSQLSSMTLNTFLVAMISYPAALRNLQAELDACCGDGKTSSLRLPSLSDMFSMPYCAATVKEVIRWRPGVPVAP
jgi:cytochrome P450 family 619